MKSSVLNCSIGARSYWSYPELNADQENELLAQLFEQLMLFDKVVIRTNRLNFGMFFLLKSLGIQTVEKLLERNCIEFLLWTPILVSGTGTVQDDGSIDESIIYSQPPVVGGMLSDKDQDPEENIDKALSCFPMSRSTKRDLTKKALKKYIIPNGMQLSTDSAKLVIESYQNNVFSSLGLPYEKEPVLLNLEERNVMLRLGQSLIETSVLSEYNLKSYRNYEHFEIVKQSIKRIGKAFKIAENTESILSYEHTPDIKKLFLQEKLEFDSVFKLRHSNNAKYFRRWINGIGEVVDSKEITIEYLNEIKGKYKVPMEDEKNFLLTVSSILAGAAISSISNELIGLATSAGLTVFENYFLDNLLKGKNPSMFIEDIKANIKKD